MCTTIMLGVYHMSDLDYGHVEVLIDAMLCKRKMSKNVLAEKANLQRTQLNSYCNNKIKRIDFEVLSRICYVLECDVHEILRYSNPKEKEGEGRQWK